jgi:hypothetical protein
VGVDWPGRQQDIKALEVAWDDSGRRLAVWASTGSGASVGLADAYSLQFRELHHIGDLHPDGMASPRLLWLGDSLLCYYQAKRESPYPYNVVLRIDTVTGEADEILREERWDPSRGPVDTALASPDGRYVAFDRSSLAGGTCLGLWLLDLKSRECSEITYEYASRYRHRLLTWEAPNVIAFRRYAGPAASEEPDGQPGWAAYRAHLWPPALVASSRGGVRGGRKEAAGEAYSSGGRQKAALGHSRARDRPRHARTATRVSMSGHEVQAREDPRCSASSAAVSATRAGPATLRSSTGTPVQATRCQSTRTAGSRLFPPVIGRSHLRTGRQGHRCSCLLRSLLGGRETSVKAS